MHYGVVYYCRCVCVSRLTPPYWACTQAEQRQANFETSAVGKAAYKSVDAAKRPTQSSGAPDNAKDWLS